MVMSIDEQITALEEELANTKGPGSVAKKEEIQKEIDKLKDADKETPEEKTPEATPLANYQPLPPYKKVSKAQIEAAEEAGTLCGVDFENMTASIKV